MFKFPAFFFYFSCASVLSKKAGFSCAIPVDSMFTSIDFVGMSSLIFRNIFSSASISKRDIKSAAVLNFPGMCAIVKLNYSTNSLAFHKGRGIIFV